MKWDILDSNGRLLGCLSGEVMTLETARTHYPEADSFKENTQDQEAHKHER